MVIITNIKLDILTIWNGCDLTKKWRVTFTITKWL